MSTDKVSSSDPRAIAAGLSEDERRVLSPSTFIGKVRPLDARTAIGLVRKGLYRRVREVSRAVEITPLGVAVRGALTKE